MDLTRISKYLSLILRHKPETIGIKLDNHGWADVSKIIRGIAKKYPEFDMEILEEIVRRDEKGRYSFNEDKTKIRANQGHSVNVDVELQECIPPDMLYHGTGRKFLESIMKTGLNSGSRLYVHISPDFDAAVKVGSRHGSPVVLGVDTGKMHEDGYVFYKSVNGVWLTKEVPIKYLKVISYGENYENN